MNYSTFPSTITASRRYSAPKHCEKQVPTRRRRRHRRSDSARSPRSFRKSELISVITDLKVSTGETAAVAVATRDGGEKIRKLLPRGGPLWGSVV